MQSASSKSFLEGDTDNALGKLIKDAFNEVWNTLNINLKPEFLRKLGFSSGVVDLHVENPNSDNVFSHWKGLEKSDKDLFELVRQEVLCGVRDPKVDELLKPRKAFLRNRNESWFMYSFCQFYFIESKWKSVVHNKLMLPPFRVYEIDVNYKGNIAERQYRMMSLWKDVNNLDLQQMVTKLQMLNLHIPLRHPYLNDENLHTTQESQWDNQSDIESSEDEENAESADIASEEADVQPDCVTEAKEKLYQHLEAEAKQKCGKEYQRPVDPVNLSLAKYCGGLQNKDQQEGAITVENMFELAGTTSDKQHGISVAVVGAVGVGKTTLTKIFVNYILCKKILAAASFVFYIKVGSIDLDEKISLFDLLFLPALIRGLDLTENEKRTVLRHILADTNAVVVIDGLDEAGTIRLREDQKMKSPFSEAKPMIFLCNIIKGQIMPFARKLVTSRITEFLDASPVYRPPFIVEILGLDLAAQEELAKSVCGSKFEEVYAVLRANSELVKCCNIPVNMHMILNYLMQAGNPRNSTLTEVYVAMLKTYICSKHNAFHDDRDAAVKLAELAWHGFCHNKVFFNHFDLAKFGVPLTTQHPFVSAGSNANLFMMVLNTDRVNFFVHRSWMELLVAIKILLMPSEGFTSILEDAFASGDFANVLKFLFGLYRKDTLKNVKSLVTPSELKMKRECLISIAENKAKQLLDGHAKSSKLIQKWFHLFSCVNELGSKDIFCRIAQLLPGECNLVGAVFASDISNMFSIYKYSPIQLKFNRVQFHAVGGELQTLSGFVQEGKVKISTLRLLSWHDEQAVYLEKCIPFVDDCFIRASSDATTCVRTATSIRNALIHTGNQLVSLDLRGCPLHDDGLASLSDCIHLVATLIIANCFVTNVDKLAEQIAKLKTPMTKLIVGVNDIRNVGAKAIATCLHNIELLDMHRCKITSDGVPYLANALDLLKEPLHSLNLTGNCIADAGTKELATRLHKVKNLDLSNCEIMSVGLQDLANGLSALHGQMEKLTVSGNVDGTTTDSIMQSVKEKVRYW